MFTAPYNFDIDNGDKVIQLELIELQRGSVLGKGIEKKCWVPSIFISLLAHQFSKII
jgi:hypothetical protein